jgi:hypothetical protein
VSGISVTRRRDGSIRIGHLTPWSTAVLCELERLLDPNQPEAVKRRLFPLPSDDATHQAEWARYVHPDLFALVASAREIVAEDLERLETPGPGDPDEGTGWRLSIPAPHVPGWISALNTARLTLAELHEIGEKELEQIEFDLLDDASMAVAKMRLYGWIQQLVLECQYPGIDCPE